MIDATYKTTKYDLALFLFVLEIIFGSYMVSSEFIVQSETLEQILEALTILQSWNPAWHPRCIMTDYSEVEYDALEHCFLGVKVYLCDFYCEQCWEGWIMDSKHNEERKNLLEFLCNCSKTPLGG